MKKKQRAVRASPAPAKGRLAWIVLAVVVLLVIVVRLRLLDMPLERDEGEYAYFGQLIRQGVPPYRAAYNMKFPGTYFMYALIMSLCGETAQGIHLGLLVVNLACIFFLYLLVKKLSGGFAAAAAASAFAVLSLSRSVFGFAAHATHFVTLAALAGAFFLAKGVNEKRRGILFLSGILLGLAPIMKQPGIFFCLFGAVYLLYSFLARRKDGSGPSMGGLAWLLAGMMIPAAAMVAALKGWGVFDRFWFWTFRYAADYERQFRFGDALANFQAALAYVTQGFHLLWIAAAAGLVILFLPARIRRIHDSPFILSFVLCSFLSICPGFYFRQHYFITLLPALALLFGVALDQAREWSRLPGKAALWKPVGYGLLVIPIAVGLHAQKGYFFMDEPVDLSRAIYGLNPFPESPVIGHFIQSNSRKEDTVAVLGSEPQIYFYARRRSASGHIYMYGLMEQHRNSLKMQKEMAIEIEAARPKFVVFVNASASWLARKDSEKFIFSWASEFLQKNRYRLRGIVDIYSDATVYKWDDEAAASKPASPCFVEVFARST